MTAIQAASLWTGLLILVLVALSVRVMVNRRRHRVSLGDGGVEQMTVVSRAFGNAAEYAPPAIGALILMALLGLPAWAVHAVGGGMFLGRVVHPIGLAIRKAPNWARITGMALTWLSLTLAALMLITYAFVT